MVVCPLCGECFQKKKNDGAGLNLLLGIVTVLLIFFIIFNALVAVCSVDGASMSNTLSNKETILLERSVSEVHRGEIITISGMSDVLIIKRAIAVEGDRLVFRQNAQNHELVELFLSVDGGEFTLLNEDYIKEPMTTFGWGIGGEPKLFYGGFRLAEHTIQPDEFTHYAISVGKGECFVMGDNRNDSKDSRFYGLGKTANIKGRMFYSVPKNSPLEKILLFIYRERG